MGSLSDKQSPHSDLRGDAADHAVPLQPRPAVTWRSVLLGTLSVMLVCGLGPFNDFVLANSFLVGSYLPPVMVICFFALIVLVNGPLHRWAPRRAVSAGELAVVMAMMLAACAIPGTGMMRFLLPSLVAPFHFGALNNSFWTTFVGLNLPAWLYPVASIERGINDPVISGFYFRVQDGSVPYAAWLVPLAAWGVFVGAMVASMVAMAALVRHQWAVNERLAFPLAQLELSLIESPRPGRMLNDLLGNRLFWIGLLTVFLLHTGTALQKYFPKVVPAVPLSFDLSGVLANEPWRYLGYAVKSATIYFTFIGIAYFIQSRISFSLWAFFLLAQLANVQQRMVQSDIPGAAWRDQHLGAAVMMVLGVVWIGRHQWLRIVRNMVGRTQPGETLADARWYSIAAWTLVVSLLVMTGWLMVMGVQLWIAILIVAFILLAHALTSRIVAETGLPFVRMDASVTQIEANLSPAALRGQDVYFSGVFTVNGVVPSRESVMSFALHGMQVTANAGEPRPGRRSVIALLVWALVLGMLVSVASSLWCYYNYATPLTPQVQTFINDHALDVRPRSDFVDPLARWSTQHQVHQPHNSWLHMGIGAGITALLQVATLRWAAWPLAPVGYVLASSWYMQVAWFSLLLGWAAKVLLLRYGGAKLYQQARPLFVGLVFGEALAAGLWMVINIILASLNVDYRAITLLPT